jgi:predicted alpha/beta-fold hydrolase
LIASQPLGDFHPPRLLRNPHLQSILPSLPGVSALLRRRAYPLLKAARELILDCGDGVRLQAFHSPSARPSSSLAVLLHGWEGSAESSNILSLAACLYEAGFAVVRLNLRDHGATHHLNSDIFHSCRLPEVVGAVRSLAALFPDAKLKLAGFSLGGNFLLRVAADPGVPPAVAAVVAVSPVLHPARTLAALERGWRLYREHFVRRWSTSLRGKARAWPGLYDFAPLLESADLRHMTAVLVKQCTDFRDIDAYLEGYAITGARLATLRVPATVLLAADDPIIPTDDIARLARSPWLRHVITAHGGHCGFIDRLTPTFADRFVLECLREPCAGADVTASATTAATTAAPAASLQSAAGER